VIGTATYHSRRNLKCGREAALFVPLRWRIQNLTNRRCMGESMTLRDEVDLQRLTEGLLAVVDETMQPALMSLWLKQTDVRRET